MTEAKHLAVFGSSGSGKTTLLRELHAEFDGVSIFLTTKNTESGVAGKQVSGMHAMATAGEGASNWSSVRMKWYGASYPDAVEVARKYAHNITETVGVPVQIIVDEVQNAASFTDGAGPVKDGLHEDRDRGIKWVISTQSPQDLKTSQNGYGPIQQCQFIVWVGAAKTWHEGFLKHHFGAGYRELVPGEKYRYHVIDPSVPPTVVHRGETDPDYS